MHDTQSTWLFYTHSLHTNQFKSCISLSMSFCPHPYTLWNVISAAYCGSWESHRISTYKPLNADEIKIQIFSHAKNMLLLSCHMWLVVSILRSAEVEHFHDQSVLGQHHSRAICIAHVLDIEWMTRIEAHEWMNASVIREHSDFHITSDKDFPELPRQNILGLPQHSQHAFFLFNTPVLNTIV